MAVYRSTLHTHTVYVLPTIHHAFVMYALHFYAMRQLANLQRMPKWKMSSVHLPFVAPNAIGQNEIMNFPNQDWLFRILTNCLSSVSQSRYRASYLAAVIGVRVRISVTQCHPHSVYVWRLSFGAMLRWLMVIDKHTYATVLTLSLPFVLWSFGWSCIRFCHFVIDSDVLI